MSDRNKADRVFDERLTKALQRRPSVPLPASFAVRVAAAATSQSRPFRALPRRPSLGIATGVAAMVVLLVLMVRLAIRTTGPSPVIVELTLCTEFLLLLGGLLYLKVFRV